MCWGFDLFLQESFCRDLFFGFWFVYWEFDLFAGELINLLVFSTPSLPRPSILRIFAKLIPHYIQG